MTLVGLIVALTLLAFLMYVINTFIPGDPKIKQLLNVLVIVILVVWVLQQFGWLGPLNDIRIK